MNKLPVLILFSVLLLGMPSAAFAQPVVAIAVVIDGSGSISPSEFTIMKDGIVDAITTVIPPDGSVEMTVIQFAGGSAVVECPLVVISSPAVKAVLIACVDGISQNFGGTPMSTGITLATSVLNASPNFGITSLINLVTDGSPNSEAATTTAATAAQNAGITGLSAFGIGTSVSTLDFLAIIVFPGGSPGPILVLPAVIPDPAQQGFVIDITDFMDFGPAFAEKLQKEIDKMVIIGGELLPINTTALLLAGVQSISMWMIPVVVAGAGIGVFVTMRSRK